MIRAALDAGVGYVGLVASKVAGSRSWTRCGSPTPSVPACTPRSDWPSAPRHLRRSRCRSWPKSSRPSGSTAWRRPRARHRTRRRERTHGRSPVTGVVLAAGSSAARHAETDTAVPRHDALGATLAVARSCPFDQIIVTLGGAARGCASRAARRSRCGDRRGLRLGLFVVAAHRAGPLDPRAAGIVLMLGDQPSVSGERSALIVAGGRRRDRGVPILRRFGHPFWLSRSVFGELAGCTVTRVCGSSSSRPVHGAEVSPRPVPLDVDTWDDYERLLDSVAR